MAVFSARGSPFSRRNAGTRPNGLILRYASERCSPFDKSTRCGSYFSPLSSKTICAAIEHAPGVKYSVNIPRPFLTKRADPATKSNAAASQYKNHDGKPEPWGRDNLADRALMA